MFFMPCCVDRPTMRFLELSWLVRYSMRNKALVFVAVLLGACSSQTASLDNARNQLVQTRTDYRDRMNAGSGEGTNQCEAKLAAADNAERAYKEAMSSGLP
jgi:hypothetical protein